MSMRKEFFLRTSVVRIWVVVPGSDPVGGEGTPG
jgi:hypothetical protein